MSKVAHTPLHIGVLLYGCGHHQAAWLMEDSSIERVGDITYYQELAQLSEKGLLDAVFFADNQSFPATTDRTMPAFWFDPIVNLTAISQATTHIGLVSTISSTFSNPYTVARQLLSLDHITGGRVGWNLVTSMTDLEAQNHSMTHLPDHASRYAKAAAFADVMDELLTSWSTDQFLADRTSKRILDSEHITPFDYKDDYFQVKGPLSTPQSPQHKPVAMQAGASKQGVALAAKHADAVYAVAWNMEQARSFRERIDTALRDIGDTRHIQIFPGLVTYVADTYEAALEKKAKLDAALPIEDALKQLSFFVQQDCTKWALDEPVPELPPLSEFTGPSGRYETILNIIQDKQPTVRELLGYLNAGGGHLTLIGTPEMIVDEMEAWFNAGVADGFNLMPPTLPHSLEDFVTYVVPELQKRGLYRTHYTGQTFREHLGLS
ncbi:LLM class flavin-dependent oxidoreductase [Staphylococcus canis]|uniref:LLM class flavin-dependent oxidoreductase n=1 Tax=Staphylococcus canis TaxID=2724942 RepID=A0ABS0TCL4_9STAP|nr:LLM class flavin-dependent oxidoreductase [Staphylococcus canis]MBI5975711.1 LLM class flavin-dependent oxidoreductase [Staphylococcus canis]